MDFLGAAVGISTCITTLTKSGPDTFPTLGILIESITS